MLRAGLRIFLLCWLSLTVSADASRKWTDAANMGLRDPVHTQLFTTKKLQDDPRSHPKLHIWSPIAWMVFDPRGFFIEQSNSLREDGSPEAVSRTRYDSEGRFLESSDETVDGVTTWRNEYRSGPHGVIESKAFRGGELQNWQTTDYDAGGNVIEIRTYNASDEALSRASYGYDERGRVIEWRVIGPHDELQIHLTDRYDQAGDLSLIHI